jgi:hypothetical protein
MVCSDQVSIIEMVELLNEISCKKHPNIWARTTC